MTLVLLALLISTAAFAGLYYQLLGKDSARLPKWPKPSISPLGKYSRAAVAADNEYCSEIGRNVLLHGGNAVDASVAALFCIGVMDSHSAGLGGGHFMTIYNATTQQCTVIDAREVAPKAATEDMYRNRWNDSRTGEIICSSPLMSCLEIPGNQEFFLRDFSTFFDTNIYSNITSLKKKAFAHSFFLDVLQVLSIQTYYKSRWNLGYTLLLTIVWERRVDSLWTSTRFWQVCLIRRL
ncbi:hypothetical protein COOONC_25978 [Cooperia oncophora]